MSVVIQLVTINESSDDLVGEIPIDRDLILPKYRTGSRRWSRYRKYIKDHFDEAYYKDNSLVLPCIMKWYRHGWSFANKLFNSSLSIYYAFTKSEMLQLMNTLIDTSTPEGKSIYKDFKTLNFVEGEDIFEISW